MLEEKKYENQAVTCHPVFFDAFNKSVSIDIRDGKPIFTYSEEEPAATLYENGDVKFCLYAPNATKVEVAGISGTFSTDRIALKKEEDGYFRETVHGIKPGFHYYHWFVDDIQIQNMKGTFGYGCFDNINFLEIPENTHDFYLFKDVPHGDISTTTYRSSVNQQMKLCYVYTPPEYSKNLNQNYPVLYLMHGVGESETGWIWHGKMNFILDNLIAEGKCKSMIVVMVCGYAFEEGKEAIFYPGDFDRELVHDCIPIIEEKYRVIRNQKARSIAGLSLGSAQASLSFSKHPELFSSLGVFSGARIDELQKVSAEHASAYQYIFLSCGKGEKELMNCLPNYQHEFQKMGIACDIESYEGFHEWHVWRKSLRDFVIRTFAWEFGPCEQMNQTEITYTEKEYVQQTCLEQATFFNPIYKSVIFDVDEKGPPAGRYVDEPHGADANEDGTVTFRMTAPNAKRVTANICGRILELKPDEKRPGSWIGIMEGLTPGFWYYSYDIDGTATVNPWAPVGYGGFMALNFVEIPEKDHREYYLKDIPHGSIHMDYVRSSVTGRCKLSYVYTPYGYEKETEYYPVLYLQHGGGENETGWVWQGKIANILDDMIYHNRCKKMIVVMSTGYSFYPDGSGDNQMGCVDEEIIKDILPYIEQKYRTMRDRDHRAAAGLSMGGFQVQKLVWGHPELFASVGAFSSDLITESAGQDFSKLFQNIEKFKKEFKLVFAGCGKQDGFYQKFAATYETFQKMGINPILYLTEGNHDWTFWRHCVVEFLQRVFQ